MSVTLSQPSKLTGSIFLDALEDWQHPPDSWCGRKFSNEPAEEVPSNEDVTFDEHGHADTSWNCTGVRVSSRRVTLNLKSFLVFSVDLLSRGGNLKFSNTPQSIFCLGNALHCMGQHCGMGVTTFVPFIIIICGTCMMV